MLCKQSCSFQVQLPLFIIKKLFCTVFPSEIELCRSHANACKVIAAVGSSLDLYNGNLNVLHAFGGVHTEFIRNYGITFQ